MNGIALSDLPKLSLINYPDSKDIYIICDKTDDKVALRKLGQDEIIWVSKNVRVFQSS